MSTVQCLAACALFSYVLTAEAAKILMIPFMNTSNYWELDGVGRPLVERGHTVYILVDNTSALPDNTKYKLVTYKFKTAPLQYHEENCPNGFNGDARNKLDLAGFDSFTKELCASLLNDAELFAKLRNLRLDLAIVDSFFSKCFFMVPHKLAIPFVAVGSQFTVCNSSLPVLQSLIQPLLGLEVFGISLCRESPTQLPLVRTLCRAVAFLGQQLMLLRFEESYLRQYADFQSVQQIRENASLTLVNVNSLLTTEPLPKLPNVEYVGGLTTKPGNSQSKKSNTRTILRQNHY